MKFETETGSLYEVDLESKKIRRLNGKGNPTPRQGQDGQWKKYINISPSFPVIGQSVLISWGSDVELLDETKKNLMYLPFRQLQPWSSH